MRQIGRAALDAAAQAAVTHAWQGIYQCLGVGMARIREHFARRADLDDLAGVGDGDTLGDLVMHAQVMRDDDQRILLPALDGNQQQQNAFLHHHIQRGGRLVGQDQARVEETGHGYHDPLAHAAAELVWIGRKHRGRQLELGQEGLDLGAQRLAAALPHRLRQGL